jgi:hypothetical protein
VYDEEPERSERVPSPAAGPVVFVNYPNDGSVSDSMCLLFQKEEHHLTFFLPLLLPENGSSPVCSSLIIKGLFFGRLCR